ncbi:hypothetical protein [Ruminococcus sp.]|jgi:hypothetical protein|uniref:hypothetical protein n=1 Tax=Ruminococcus sp. TaxID=41978 RepID=UPI003AB3C030
MKKFLIILISTLILLVGCQSNKVNNDVYFDKITSISWLKPDENEVNFNKEDSEKILDILSKVELSSDNEERDGGLWLKAYTDDNEKYSITICGYKNISFSFDSEHKYKISESDYDTINNLIDLYR